MTEKERRMLDRLDISKINENGRYVDVEIPLFFNLNYNQIEYLRDKYGDYTIAAAVRRPRQTPVHEEVARRRKEQPPQYTLSRDQKYNKGRHRTKNKINFAPFGKLIVGALVITLAGNMFLASIHKDKTTTIDISDPEISYETIVDSASQENIVGEYQDVYAPTIIDGKVVITQQEGEEQNLDQGTTVYEPTVEDGKYVISPQRVDVNGDLIRECCDIYHVNYEVVYPFVQQLTDNFTSEQYLNKSIQGVTCKGQQVEASTEREMMIYIVRCIKQLPHQVGINTAGLYEHSGYQSGTDYMAMIDKVSKDLGVNRCLMYAIVQSECGFNSELFNNSNNPAGIRNNGKWWRFDTKEEGFYELGMELLKYYRKIGVSPSQVDKDIIKKIGDIHAPVEDGNARWLPNVLENYEYALMNESTLFGTLGQSISH